MTEFVDKVVIDLKEKLKICKKDKENIFPSDVGPGITFGEGFYCGVIKGLECAINLLEEVD